MWKKILIGLVIILGIYFLFFRSTKEYFNNLDIKKTKYYIGLDISEKKNWDNHFENLNNIKMLITTITRPNRKAKDKINDAFMYLNKILNINYYKPIEYGNTDICEYNKQKPKFLTEIGIDRIMAIYFDYNIRLVPNTTNNYDIHIFNNKLLEDFIIQIEHFIMKNMFRRSINFGEIRKQYMNGEESTVKKLYLLSKKNLILYMPVTSVSPNIANVSVTSVSPNIANVSVTSVSPNIANVSVTSMSSSMILSPNIANISVTGMSSNVLPVSSSITQSSINNNVNKLNGLNTNYSLLESFTNNTDTNNLFGNIYTTDLDLFEKLIIDYGNNINVDSNITKTLNILYRVNSDILKVNDMQMIERYENQKQILVNSLNSVDINRRRKYQLTIKGYDDKIKKILEIKINDNKKKSIIKELSQIKSDIDFTDVKSGIEKLGIYIKDIEKTIRKSTHTNKNNLLINLSAILILFRNISRTVNCF
jgi:hypothetical protein